MAQTAWQYLRYLFENTKSDPTEEKWDSGISYSVDKKWTMAAD